MSREIKFRVHCAQTGRVLAYESFNTSLNCGYYWVDATLPEDERTCKTLDYFKHPEPLGSVKRVQFTGLRDANGVEAFDGDIILDEDGLLSKIYWSEKDFMWCVSDIGGLGELSGFGFKVIGNIYEHPHLLDDSK